MVIDDLGEHITSLNKRAGWNMFGSRGAKVHYFSRGETFVTLCEMAYVMVGKRNDENFQRKFLHTLPDISFCQLCIKKRKGKI